MGSDIENPDVNTPADIEPTNTIGPAEVVVPGVVVPLLPPGVPVKVGESPTLGGAKNE